MKRCTVMMLGAVLCLFGVGVRAQDGTSRLPIKPNGDPWQIATRAAKQKEVPDIDMLLRVTLPSNPSKSEVIDYVNVIGVLSRNQRSTLAGDPQVGMLMKVGREHLDVLLANSTSGPLATYATRAIAMLVSEQDKPWVVQHVAGNQGLAYVLLAKGWCVDAEPVLLQILKNSSAYLYDDIVDCIAYLPKATYLPAVREFLAQSGTSTSVLREIRGLPGVDISSELPEAWDLAYRNSDRYELGYWTYEALAVGHLPAFHFLFASLHDNQQLPITIFDAEALIRQFTALHCGKDELAAWYQVNRAYIRFDRHAQRFTAASRKRKLADRCPITARLLEQ